MQILPKSKKMLKQSEDMQFASQTFLDRSRLFADPRLSEDKKILAIDDLVRELAFASERRVPERLTQSLKEKLEHINKVDGNQHVRFAAEVALAVGSLPLGVAAFGAVLEAVGVSRERRYSEIVNEAYHNDRGYNPQRPSNKVVPTSAPYVR